MQELDYADVYDSPLHPTRKNLIAVIEEHTADLDALFAARTTERWFRAISEEAGEVVGAFNKWQDGNTLKPRGPADVLEESGQLLGCLVAAMGRLGFSFGDLLGETDRFLVAKAAAIEKRRAAHGDPKGDM
jgi:hypothetical protein